MGFKKKNIKSQNTKVDFFYRRVSQTASLKMNHTRKVVTSARKYIKGAQKKVNIKFIPINEDGEIEVNKLTSLITNNTKIIVLNNITYLTFS